LEPLCFSNELQEQQPQGQQHEQPQGLRQRRNIKVCILMHSKEYLCAGNSAKLLLPLLPPSYQQQQHQEHCFSEAELFLYGKTGEVDRLYREMNSQENHQQATMILWPGKHALTVSEFLNRLSNNNSKKANDDSFIPSVENDGDDNADDDAVTTTTTKCSGSGDHHPHPSAGTTTTATTTIIRAIVLDGTYTQARNMLSSLTKRWGANQMPVTVALSPASSSVFHRAQKNYTKAHRQQEQKQQPQDHPERHEGDKNENNNGADETTWVQRVSTAEACGLLLVELGAPVSVQEKIVQAVLINNQALAFARTPASGKNAAKADEASPGSESPLMDDTKP